MLHLHMCTCEHITLHNNAIYAMISVMELNPNWLLIHLITIQLLIWLQITEIKYLFSYWLLNQLWWIDYHLINYQFNYPLLSLILIDQLLTLLPNTNSITDCHFKTVSCMQVYWLKEHCILGDVNSLPSVSSLKCLLFHDCLPRTTPPA